MMPTADPLRPRSESTEPTTTNEPTPGATPVPSVLSAGTPPGPSAIGTQPSTADGHARRRTWGKGALVAAAFVATLVVGIGIGRAGSLGIDVGGPGATASGSSSASSSEFALIAQAWDTIHTQYVDRADLDDQALAYGAIEGIANAVGDTGHTSFLTPAELADRHNQLSGSYVGIGVRIDPAPDGRPLVVGIFDGSPAAGSGLKVGDIIASVDGKTTTGVDLDTVSSWIRGAADTKVTLTVTAGTDGPSREYTITRADVPITAVSWTMVPGTKTGLLRLESFSTGAADEVVAALKAIKAAGADRLILDLRGDPGGYVNEAVGIASQFISTGDVYIERDANGHETHHPVSPNGVALDLPLVVLVDNGTASSSEILAGALQDAKRAQIIGVTTFGTGTVLGEFSLKDGSALRIGTVEWLTPAGRRIWHTGITPDVTVERASTVALVTPDAVRTMTVAEVAAITDPQLARALSVVASAP